VPLPEGIRGVLLDVEGTTTAIRFVYDVLFPFAEARLDEACARQGENPPIADAVALLRQEYQEETLMDGAQSSFGNGAAYARRLMAEDRKSTGLKALQGLIWEEGYREGALQAHVFEDVPAALRAWKEAGVRLRVFSSGSVLAQKLLFGHTEHGDLLPCFEGYHDTTTGPKREPRAYHAIAESYGLPPEEILFLSDIREELDAAREAGMATGLVRRPGNRPAEAGGHAVYESFAELV
jgi:enolase-phosphatase E1